MYIVDTYYLDHIYTHKYYLFILQRIYI
jgi:hypothetical protein